MQEGILQTLREYENDPEKRQREAFWMTNEDLVRMRRFIRGDPDPAQGEEGLRNTPPEEGEAVQTATYFLDEQFEKNGGFWPGLRRAKQLLLERPRLEMYLQAAYMLYHETD